MPATQKSNQQIQLPSYNYDLDFRPATYWSEAKAARANVTGTLRRAALEHALREGDSQLAHGAMNDAAGALCREALGAIHPQLRSGEDLKPVAHREVEIARITLDSVHGEVTSIRARSRNGRILYRVDDETANDFGYKIHIKPGSSTLPLTMQQLIGLIDTAQSEGMVGLVTPHWFRVLRVDGSGYSEAVDFVRISSYFYPLLGAWYAVRLREIAEQRKRAAVAGGWG